MHYRTSPMPNIKTKLRQSLILPQKSIKIGTFFNEKVQNAVGTTHYHFTTSSQRQPNIRRQKRFSFTVSPKYQLSNKMAMSFDDFVQTKNTFHKLLKYSSLQLQQNKGKMNIALRKSSSDKPQQIYDHDKQLQKLINSKKSVLLGSDHHDIIKRQLQQKFNRTRLIFKEQQKLKKYDRINRIYDRKNPIKRLGKSQNTQNGFDGSQNNQNMKYSPWQKNRVQSCEAQIYQVNQSEQQVPI